MPVIIDGTNGIDLPVPLPVSEGGTGSTVNGSPAAFGRVVRTAGDITTTSTTLVDVTGATVTFTTGAFPVAYGVAHTSNNGTSTATSIFNVAIDGTLQNGSSGYQHTQQSSGVHSIISFSGQSAALTAASHTIKEQWRVNTGTGTIIASATDSATFYAQEIR